MSEKFNKKEIISDVSKISDALGFYGISDTLNMDSDERSNLFKNILKNLKNELLKKPDLEDIALLFNSDFEQIKCANEKENKKYLGGMFYMKMDSESTFIMNFEMFFQLPNGKYNKVSGQSDSINIEEQLAVEERCKEYMILKLNEYTKAVRYYKKYIALKQNKILVLIYWIYYYNTMSYN